MKRTKPLFRAMTAILAAAVFALPASAKAVKLTLDGVELPAVNARLIDGTTYVPLRAFAGEMGDSTVSWDSASGVARARSAGLDVTAAVGASYIEANGRAFHAPSGVRLVEGTLMLPLRPLARAYGLDVGWESENATATLARTGSVAAPASAVYDADTLNWLARIISAEARGEPFAGQLAVGNVILNRVASPDFPNTVYGVIFDRQWGVQFTPTANGTIYDTPTPSAVIAAKLALEGYTLSPDVLYFLNPDIATSFWITENRPFAFKIGGHAFYT